MCLSASTFAFQFQKTAPKIRKHHLDFQLLSLKQNNQHKNCIFPQVISEPQETLKQTKTTCMTNQHSGILFFKLFFKQNHLCQSLEQQRSISSNFPVRRQLSTWLFPSKWSLRSSLRLSSKHLPVQAKQLFISVQTCGRWHLTIDGDVSLGKRRSFNLLVFSTKQSSVDKTGISWKVDRLRLWRSHLDIPTWTPVNFRQFSVGWTPGPNLNKQMPERWKPHCLFLGLQCVSLVGGWLSRSHHTSLHQKFQFQSHTRPRISWERHKPPTVRCCLRLFFLSVGKNRMSCQTTSTLLSGRDQFAGKLPIWNYLVWMVPGWRLWSDKDTVRFGCSRKRQRERETRLWTTVTLLLVKKCLTLTRAKSVDREVSNCRIQIHSWRPVHCSDFVSAIFPEPVDQLKLKIIEKDLHKPGIGCLWKTTQMFQLIWSRHRTQGPTRIPFHIPVSKEKRFSVVQVCQNAHQWLGTSVCVSGGSDQHLITKLVEESHLHPTRIICWQHTIVFVNNSHSVKLARGNANILLPVVWHLIFAWIAFFFLRWRHCSDRTILSRGKWTLRQNLEIGSVHDLFLVFSSICTCWGFEFLSFSWDFFFALFSPGRSQTPKNATQNKQFCSTTKHTSRKIIHSHGCRHQFCKQSVFKRFVEDDVTFTSNDAIDEWRSLEKKREVCESNDSCPFFFLLINLMLGFILPKLSDNLFCLFVIRKRCWQSLKIWLWAIQIVAKRFKNSIWKNNNSSPVISFDTREMSWPNTIFHSCMQKPSVDTFKKKCLKLDSFRGIVDVLLTSGFDPTGPGEDTQGHLYFDLLLTHCLENKDMRCNGAVSLICRFLNWKSSTGSRNVDTKQVQWCSCFQTNKTNRIQIPLECTADCISDTSVKVVEMVNGMAVTRKCTRPICEIGNSILFSDENVDLVQKCPQCQASKCSCVIDRSVLVFKDNKQSSKKIVGILNDCNSVKTVDSDQFDSCSRSQKNISLVVWTIIALLVVLVFFAFFKLSCNPERRGQHGSQQSVPENLLMWNWQTFWCLVCVVPWVTN